MILKSAALEKLSRNDNVDRTTRFEYFSISYWSSHCLRSFLKKFSKIQRIYEYVYINAKKLGEESLIIKIRETLFKRLIVSAILLLIHAQKMLILLYCNFLEDNITCFLINIYRHLSIFAQNLE